MPLLLLGLFLAACSKQEPVAEPTADAAQPAPPPAATAPSASAELSQLTADYMQLAAELNPILDLLSGKPLTALPDRSDKARRMGAEAASDLLTRLQAIDREALSHQERITAAMVERELSIGIEEFKHHWVAFSATPYQAGFVFSALPASLQAAQFTSGEDVDRYLGLVADIGRFVRVEKQRLEGQSERGVVLPKAALPGVRAVFGGLQASLPAAVTVADERMVNLSAEDRQTLLDGIDILLAERLMPAVEELLAYLGDGYAERAPQAVGPGQYPGGKDFYRFAIRRETTLDFTPEEIHQKGLDWMAEIQAEMAEIRKELGFEGTQLEFHEKMRGDARFYASSPEEVEERFMAYIAEIEPFIPQYFSLLPKAPYGVKRLDPAAEAGMTFGFYQAPSILEKTGLYRYNGSELESRPTVWEAPLIFHELIPGHHFHFALQSENEDLPDVRKRGTFIAAFNEGWGNYGASLAVEMGIIDDPWERYGWLLFQSFHHGPTGARHRHELLWLAARQGAPVHARQHLFLGDGSRDRDPALLHRHAGPGAGLQAGIRGNPGYSARSRATVGRPF